MSIFSSFSGKNLTPAGNPTPGRVLHRPDARGLILPSHDASPLGDEVDYDSLIVHKTWRSYEHSRPSEVRYFMYELSHRDAHEAEFSHFFKAVRFLRITRVPRYLRQSIGNGPNKVFEQQRDLLSALREQDVLFTQVISRLPNTPLIFAWGVQATGATPEEAQQAADEAFAVLRFQVEGVYQQLKYKPITLEEGEAINRMQNEWRNIAMARGRPVPSGNAGGAQTLLDGNRTDIESTNNQLEAFIRGMSDKQFLLTMTTVPVTPLEMSNAWRNISEKLSAVRSDQQGTRSFTASVAIPLAMGSTLGRSEGDSHQTGSSTGNANTETVSTSVSDGTSQSTTQGTSQSLSDGYTIGTSQSIANTQGQSLTDSVNQGTTLGESVSQGASNTVGMSDTYSVGQGQSQSISESIGESVSQSQGQTQSVNSGRSIGINESQSASETATLGRNWGTSLSNSLSANQSVADGWNRSFSEGLSQTFGQTVTNNSSLGDGIGSNNSGGVNGGLGGANAGTQSGTSGNFNRSLAFSDAFSGQFGNTLGRSDGISSTLTNGIGQTLTSGENQGGSQSMALSNTNSVGRSESLSVSQGESFSQTATQGLNRSLGQSESVSTNEGRAMGRSLAGTDSASQGASLASNAGVARAAGQSIATTETQGVSEARSQTATVGQSQSQTEGTSRTNTAGASTAEAKSLAASDAFMASMSRSTSTAASFGIAPAIGITTSKALFDEGKRSLGDLIENQRKRYEEALNGAWLYQLSLVCPDAETLAGGSALLKQAFWGAGSAGPQPQPFHVVKIQDREEADRLLVHLSAFSMYRRRETQTELLEPYHYSSFLTHGEGSSVTHPPTLESIGLLAQHDSMPVFAQPADRQDRDIYLGHIINGERDEVTDTRFGIDLDEITHVLVAGATGSGKTTGTMRLASEAVRSYKMVTEPDPENPLLVRERKIPAGVLALDWKSDLRGLLSAIPAEEAAERFKFFSMSKPQLGRFRFNVLALPDNGISANEWANTVADLFATSYGLGDFARSLVWEAVNELYSINRLEDYTLLQPLIDGDTVLRPAVTLPAIAREDLPADAVGTDYNGEEVANVFTCPELSRLVSMQHVAIWLIGRKEFAATTEGARLLGSNFRDRVETAWRRLMPIAPGGDALLGELFSADPDLDTRLSLSVTDLVDPEKGLVTVLEADGLDHANRAFVLSSILLAVYRRAAFHGDGSLNLNGQGPGTFVILEESHEIFGDRSDDESRSVGASRAALFESIFRRARSLGMKLVAVTQNPASLPSSVTSACSTVIGFRVVDEKDRKTMSNLYNWLVMLGQAVREYRYLGEQNRGNAIVRLDPIKSFLEAAPVHIQFDPTDAVTVTDAQLAALDSKRD